MARELVEYKLGSIPEHEHKQHTSPHLYVTSHIYVDEWPPVPEVKQTLPIIEKAYMEGTHQQLQPSNHSILKNYNGQLDNEEVFRIAKLLKKMPELFDICNSLFCSLIVCTSCFVLSFCIATDRCT